MIGWLRSTLGRSRLTRRLTVVALSLVALSVVASVLTPAPRPEQRQGAPGSTGIVHPPVSRHPAPVSAGGLARARQVAKRFLVGYLPFLYGHGRARAIEGVVPSLRLKLTRTRTLVTPVERRRHPRLMSLAAIGQANGAVLATAFVEDGGVTAYALRVILRREPAGWLVSGVEGG